VLKLQERPKIPQQPPQHDFIPTLPSQESAQVDPNAVLESERNTALRSREAAKSDSPLPSMSGDSKSGLVWQSTPQSPAINSNPSQASPQSQKTQQAQPSPNQPTQQQNPQKATQTSKAAPPALLGDPTKKENAQAKNDTPVLGSNGVPLFVAPTDPTGAKDGQKDAKPNPKPADKTDQEKTEQQQQQQQQVQQQQAQPQQNPSQAAPPPSAPSFARAKSQLNGSSSQDPGDPSPSSKETEIGRYKAKLYRTIGSRWYLNVEKNQTLLGVGEVRFKFFVRSNGTIDQITTLTQSGDCEVLKGVSLRSIKEAVGDGFEVFSDNMKQQLGDGYWEEITFSIY
ncbi:MAG TPA: hypothetical protein VIM58_08440, partial [Candidatus Methylacidiphilales bacterium]